MSRTLGSYESWCEVVGGVLEHSGIYGFLAGAAEDLENVDECSTEAAMFLTVLEEAFGGKRFTSSEVYALCVQSTGHPAITAVMPDELAEALYDSALFVRRLGRWFAERADRRFGESQIHIKRAGTAHKVQVWEIANPLATSGSVTVQ